MAENPKTRAGQKKPPLHLVPPTTTHYAAAPMADGADKYGPYNWRTPDTQIPVSIYVSAAKRHIDAFWDGGWFVRDSRYGANHIGAAIAGLSVLADAFEVGTVFDDRPAPGTSEDLQDYWQHNGTLWVPGAAVRGDHA